MKHIKLFFRGNSKSSLCFEVGVTQGTVMELQIQPSVTNCDFSSENF